MRSYVLETRIAKGLRVFVRVPDVYWSFVLDNPSSERYPALDSHNNSRSGWRTDDDNSKL